MYVGWQVGGFGREERTEWEMLTENSATYWVLRFGRITDLILIELNRINADNEMQSKNHSHTISRISLEFVR